MSGAVMDAIETGNAAFRRPSLARSAQRLFEPAGSTLEDTILGAWEDLAARGRAECPVCHAEIEHAGCSSCGSVLA
jgi:hypothetical protein